MGSLGNFKESLRPFLGRIVSTDSVPGSTRVRRDLVDDYGSLHPLHCRFAGARRTSLVPRGIHPGSQGKAQNDRLADTSGKQRYEHNKTARAKDNSFSRSWVAATGSQSRPIPKIQSLEAAHFGWSRDVARLPRRACQLVWDDFCNIPSEFRDSESGVCRTFQNASTKRLLNPIELPDVEPQGTLSAVKAGVGEILRTICRKAGFIK